MRLSDNSRGGFAFSRAARLMAVAVLVSLGPSRVWAQAPAAATAAPTATAPAQGTPIFRCDAPHPSPLLWVHNFSEVKVGDKVEIKDVWSGDLIEHAFIVHNDGDAVLKILEVRPTCGCTVAEYDKEIPPGGQGKITAKLNTTNINHETVKPITVKTNDPKAAQITLQLKGKIKARISLDPMNGAQFGQLGPTTPAERIIKITNNTETPLKLEVGPRPPQTPYSYELTEVEEGKRFEIKVTFDKDKLREGPNFAQLILKTNIEKQPQVFVPANVYVPPIIQAQPSTIAVSTPVAANFSRQITLTYRNGPMEITGVSANDPAIKVEAAPAPAPAPQPARTPAAVQFQRVPKQVWNLRVNVDQDWDPPTPPPTPYEITVTTNVQEKPEVKIRIHPYALQPRIQPETLIGKLAPLDAALKTLVGQPLRLGGNTGKVTVTCFWTSWCPHCKRLLPIMQRIANAYSSRGVDFNMISLDTTTTPEKVAEIVKDLDVTLPFAVDSKQTVGKKYGAHSFPITFLIGKDGIVEAVQKGAPASFEADIKAKLEVLLQGKRRDSFPTAAAPAQAAPQSQATRPAPAGAGHPMLVMDSMRQDMGAHKPGAAGTYNLYLRNGGSGELKLTRVTPSEGLQLDPNYPKSVPANAPAALRFRFTAPQQPGPFRHRVTIESNDPRRRRVEVQLVGTVRKLIELEPATGIDFGRRPNTFSMNRMASLRWNGEGTVQFLSVESNSAQFEGSLEPIRQGPNYMVVAKAKGPFEQGEHTATFFVKTDCKEQPVVEVPVKLFQPPRIDVTPPALTFTNAPRIQQDKVTIMNNGTTSFHLLEIKSSSPKIRTQAWPVEDGLSYGLQVTLLKDFSPAPEGDQVTIRTDDPEYGEIVIPVKVTSGRP